MTLSTTAFAWLIPAGCAGIAAAGVQPAIAVSAATAASPATVDLMGYPPLTGFHTQTREGRIGCRDGPADDGRFSRVPTSSASPVRSRCHSDDIPARAGRCIGAHSRGREIRNHKVADD